MQLLSDFPWYISLLCLLAGAAYSAGLYWRGKHRREEGLPRAARVALPLLRFVTVALIAFLLTAPLVRRQVSSHEKPVVAVVTDASRSVPEGSSCRRGCAESWRGSTRWWSMCMARGCCRHRTRPARRYAMQRTSHQR
ncbi:MAG: hypothetical protein IKS44_07415 [Bacteroidales bacterium]|nr:hypothetical protein [Bacteroidales bacterium]